MALCGVGSAVLFGIVFIIVVSAFADFGFGMWWVLVWVGLCWFVDFVGFGGLLGVFYICVYVFLVSWIACCLF